MAFLRQFPNLKKVDMFNNVLNLKVFKKLNELFPDVSFGCQFRFGKRRMRTDETAFSTLWAEGDRKCSYDEISMLSWCRNLYALDIGHNPVKKLDFLYDLPELRILIVAICDVTDITPIASLKHLEYLEIFHNNITDVSCLKDLKYLMDLDLVQNYVEDLTPLTEMKSLKRLWIYRNIKNDLESPDMETVRMLQEALPDCQIEARGTSRSKGWVRHPHQEVIQRIFHSKVYEPFADSDPENMPEPWRTEYLEKNGETAETEAIEPAE
jgi:Leucine-rich repeat (LRR) protein